MSQRILDDDELPAILQAVAAYFEYQGCEVDRARDPRPAAALETRHYCRVIADLPLESADPAAGVELVAHVKQLSPRPRIVFPTAHCGLSAARAARRHGAAACFHEPTPLAAVARAVGCLLDLGSSGRGAAPSPREREKRGDAEEDPARGRLEDDSLRGAHDPEERPLRAADGW